MSAYRLPYQVMPSDKLEWTTACVKDGVTSFWENERSGLDMKDFFRTVVAKEHVVKVQVGKSKYLHEPVTSTRPCLSSHNEKASARIRELSGSGGLYVCGAPYCVDSFEEEYYSGVRVGNVHSDKVIIRQ